MSRGGIVEISGYSLEVPPDMRWAFPEGRYFERNVDHWFGECLRELAPNVVFDIGANYGYYTLRAATTGARVYAFEPAPATFAVLRRTIARNGLRKVTPLDLGISDREGDAKLTEYSSSGNNSIVARAADKVAHLNVLGTRTVKTTTLDGFLRLAPAPNLIKIDAEGAELRILRAAGKLLKTQPPTLLLEHDESIAADAGYTLADVFACLEPRGYRLHALRTDPADLRLHVPAELDLSEVGSLLCVPPASPWCPGA